MNSGRMKDAEGKIIPRKIINKFEAKFNEKLIFSVDIVLSVSILVIKKKH